jgi:hypothetical protein
MERKILNGIKSWWHMRYRKKLQRKRNFSRYRKMCRTLEEKGGRLTTQVPKRESHLVVHVYMTEYMDVYGWMNDVGKVRNRWENERRCWGYSLLLPPPLPLPSSLEQSQIIRNSWFPAEIQIQVL